MGTTKDDAIEDDGSGCQQESNSSIEGSNIGEAEIAPMTPKSVNLLHLRLLQR